MVHGDMTRDEFTEVSHHILEVVVSIDRDSSLLYLREDPVKCRIFESGFATIRVKGKFSTILFF